MGKWMRRLLIVLLLAVFGFSAGRYWLIRRSYRISREGYEQAAEQYTAPSQSEAAEAPAYQQSAGTAQSGEEEEREHAPIKVDFDALMELNDDVMGWIYCEDTVINYPVVWGRDNDYYLERNFRRRVDPNGTIFADGSNLADFTDNNTILYGHHMQDMTMFATLKYWLKQDYYEEHPCMWLLTPHQDYRVELIAGYVTAADSETFTVYRGGGPELREYIRQALARSEFRSPAQQEEIDENAQYVLLSTCAYSFNKARTVLHGKLIPVESMEGEMPDTLPNGKPIDKIK